MIVFNGLEEKRMTVADFDLSSVSQDRILLPYHGKIWGDVQLSVLDAVYNSMGTSVYDIPYDDAVKDVHMKMLFNVQRAKIRVTGYLDIQTQFGSALTDRVLIKTTDCEMLEVLSAFFQFASHGLSDEFFDHYRNLFDIWKKEKII